MSQPDESATRSMMERFQVLLSEYDDIQYSLHIVIDNGNIAHMTNATPNLLMILARNTINRGLELNVEAHAANNTAEARPIALCLNCGQAATCRDSSGHRLCDPCFQGCHGS